VLNVQRYAVVTCLSDRAVLSVKLERERLWPCPLVIAYASRLNGQGRRPFFALTFGLRELEIRRYRIPLIFDGPPVLSYVNATVNVIRRFNRFHALDIFCALGLPSQSWKPAIARTWYTLYKSPGPVSAS